ncbi:MAG: hypothetical protein ACYSTZ_00050 [Planctomycetota bacterium]|jgi:hypothetical protein
MDAIKIKNLSEKLVQVNFIIDMLNGGQGARVEFSSAGPTYSVFIDVSSEHTSTYRLGEIFSRALQEYAHDLERDIMTCIRQL